MGITVTADPELPIPTRLCGGIERIIIDLLVKRHIELANDPAARNCARRTAWAAASRLRHWEHESERGTLSRLVDEALL